MGVKRAEEVLIKAALEYAAKREQTPDGLQQVALLAPLQRAALGYAAEKKKAADKRDRWKIRKRMA